MNEWMNAYYVKSKKLWTLSLRIFLNLLLQIYSFHIAPLNGFTPRLLYLWENCFTVPLRRIMRKNRYERSSREKTFQLSSRDSNVDRSESRLIVSFVMEVSRTDYKVTESTVPISKRPYWCTITTHAPRLLWNPVVHCRVQTSPRQVRILSQTNPMHIHLVM
jgi:hypothetical protein